MPAGRILKGHPFEQHVLAVVERHQHRTQKVLHLLEILARAGPGRDVLVRTRRRAEAETLRRIPRIAVLGDDAAAPDLGVPLPGGELAAFHGAPRVAVAVDDAEARNGHVLGVHRRNGRLAAPRIEPLESNLHERIERLVIAEHNHGVLLQVQLDIVFQHDGSRVPHARRNHHAAAALRREGVDGGRKGPGRKRMGVARSAEIGHAHRTRRNGRLHDGRHLERHLRRQGTAPGTGRAAAGGEGRSCRKHQQMFQIHNNKVDFMDS